MAPVILGIKQHRLGARITRAAHGARHIDFKSPFRWKVQRQFHGSISLVRKDHAFLRMLVAKLGELWIAAFCHRALDPGGQHCAPCSCSKGLDEGSTADRKSTRLNS